MIDNQANIDTNSPNPITNNLAIDLFMPERFSIEMVEASKLGDYELWGSILSVMMNFLVGFVVASITTKEKEVRSLLIGISVVFAVFVIISIIILVNKRKSLKANKSVQYTFSGITPNTKVE